MGTLAPRRMLGRSWKIALGLLCASCLLPTDMGAALDRDATRSCATADLLGLWDMVRLIARGADKVDPQDAWFFPHQRYLFRDNGTLQYTSSVQPLADDPRADPTGMVDIMAWTIYPDGWLELQRANIPYPETCACHFLLRNDKDASGRSTHRGQIMLIYMKDGKPVLQKLLRKLQ